MLTVDGGNDLGRIFKVQKSGKFLKFFIETKKNLIKKLLKVNLKNFHKQIF